MALISSVLFYVLSFWPWISALVILFLTIKLMSKTKPDPLVGLPEIKPHWIWGNNDFSKNMNVPYNEHYKKLYGLRYGIYYNMYEKRLFVMDPEICSKIMITDFDHFEYVPFLDKEYTEAMGNQLGLVDAHGEIWKNLKKSSSGAFSLIRLKKALPLFNSCSREMVDFLHSQPSEGVEIDVDDLIKRCAINTLGTVGFGMDVNSFKDRDNEFKKYADNLFDVSRFLLGSFAPSIMRIFRIPIFRKDSSTYVEKVVQQTIKAREGQNTDRKDILGALVKIHKENPKDFTMDLISKVCLQFMTDGYITIAESIICVIYMVAVRPKIQERLQEEIDRVFENKDDPNGDLTDEDINELNYLDMVFKETMRLAGIGAVPRQCTKEWKVPNSDLVLPVGTICMLPIGALQTDPKYWDDPEEFIPERFSEENKGNIKSGTYFPFGQGPRMCLGNNFARFEAKVALIYLFRNFSTVGGEKLPKKMELDANAFLLPKGGLKLKFKKRAL